MKTVLSLVVASCFSLSMGLFLNDLAVQRINKTSTTNNPVFYNQAIIESPFVFIGSVGGIYNIIVTYFGNIIAFVIILASGKFVYHTFNS